jgi:phage gpG-like protein
MPSRSSTKISDLRKRLNALGAAPSLPDVLGVAGLKLIADGFLAERDPYGAAWEPLKYRQGKILRKTGRMFNSRTYSATARRVTLAITAKYSIYHQDPKPRKPRSGRRSFSRGRRTWQLPKRTMVPDERGLPAAWDAVFQRETTAYLNRVAAGGTP